MPRTGGIYSAPAGTKGIPNTTVASTPYNSFIDDLVADANAARPITAGGTGATNATDARSNLGALASGDLLAAATKAVPVDGDGFVITDSEASGAPKRVLWSVVKAKLKEFFDPLYLSITGGTLMGTTTIRANGSVGGLVLNGGDTNTGFLGFLAANGTRIGYIGYFVASDYMNYQAESTTLGHSFNKSIRTTSGNITAAASVIATGELLSLNGVARIRSNANSHLFFENAAGVEKALFYIGNDGILNLRFASGAVTHAFRSNGVIYAANDINAGTAALQVNTGVTFGTGYNGGNVLAHVESRGSAYYTAAVNQIMPTMAAQLAGNIGTYAFLCVVPNVAMGPGSGASGSDCYYTGAEVANIKTAPPGVWRCMGRTNSSASDKERTTLFLRYA